MTPGQSEDAQAAPPAAIKAVYKKFQKLSVKDLDGHPDVVDFATASNVNGSMLRQMSFSDLPLELQVTSEDFDVLLPPSALRQVRMFEVTSIPGLLIYPSLLSSQTQLDLLDKLLHRDLRNPEHKTNIHLHYDVPYPDRHSERTTSSYFALSSKDLIFSPKDPNVHKPLTIYQVLNKKLRWITLGGQYDWTEKVYPQTKPPAFPADIKSLIENIFPMKAEAAIVNLYAPGDTLNLHKDVSEECDQPLVSISFGCDGIFVVGLDDIEDEGQTRAAVIRLRSGDAVLMSGDSRYAWHGVPKVVEGTCPMLMEDWPYVQRGDEDGDANEHLEEWKGWMKGKRINLNVRQMFDHIDG